MSHSYQVDLPSLREHFPPRFPVPAQLQKLVRWLSKQEWGSLGYFNIEGTRPSFGCEICSGSDCAERFAFFLHTPSGGLAGYWLHDGCNRASPPIVYLSSEGEAVTVGRSLADFLRRWAQDDIEIEDLQRSPDDDDDRRPDGRPLLARWIAANLGRSTGGPAPKFAAWLKTHRKQQNAWIERDLLRRRIAQELRRIAPAAGKAEEWESEMFEVVLVGSHFQVWHRRQGLKLLSGQAAARLEPLLREARERRAQIHPARGLWFQATMSVGSGRGASLQCDFYGEPTIDDRRVSIPKRDYVADLDAYPRSPYWTPPWLAKKVGRRRAVA